jgi:phosphatidylglycerophosphate synthase
VSAGYARILTGIACFSYALPLKDGSGQPVKGSEDTWKVAIALYCFSYWLDALDGVAARRLNQCAVGCRSVGLFLLPRW